MQTALAWSLPAFLHPQLPLILPTSHHSPAQSLGWLLLWHPQTNWKTEWSQHFKMFWLQEQEMVTIEQPKKAQRRKFLTRRMNQTECIALPSTTPFWCFWTMVYLRQQSTVMKSVALELDCLSWKARWPSANQLTSLSFSLLICRVGISLTGLLWIQIYLKHLNSAWPIEALY